MSKSENFFQRARRVLASNVDSALGAAERATGPALLQQAVRDLQSGRDRLERARTNAEQQASISRKRAEEHRASATRLEDDAAFALTKDREDLARDALADQLEREQAARQADEAAVDHDRQATELAAAIEELDAEIVRAQADVDAIASGQSASNTLAGASNARTERLIERSRALIDRMGDHQARDGADIAALRHADEIDARMAKLKAGPTRERGGQTD